MAGIGLPERLGLFGQLTHEEVDPAEVTIGQALQPAANLRLDLDTIQASHAFDGICIERYRQVAPGGHPSRQIHRPWCAAPAWGW
jgi:hypothetical protein